MYINVKVNKKVGSHLTIFESIYHSSDLRTIRLYTTARFSLHINANATLRSSVTFLTLWTFDLKVLWILLRLGNNSYHSISMPWINFRLNQWHERPRWLGAKQSSWHIVHGIDCLSVPVRSTPIDKFINTRHIFFHMWNQISLFTAAVVRRQTSQ